MFANAGNPILSADGNCFSALRVVMESALFTFDNSYVRLPGQFHAVASPVPVQAPSLIRFNHDLARELGLETDATDAALYADLLAGNLLPVGAEPIAQAYAGHQFGHFSPQLGDGRAILLGEIIDNKGERRDVQLKGAGQTPFSRRGDGRAALGPVLREYIVSEAMHALGIPTSRALAAVLTGEPVYRETTLPGAVLTRIAASHIRIGTFQFFAARGDTDSVRLLADHVIERHYPALKDSQNPYLALLDGVAARQAGLVARWMHVGFIHGVMNTDNMTVSGETIDFGPCAFLDEYDPAKVFSSIDQQGRYAYGNQPGIAQWNIARLAETLLPLLGENEEEAIAAANASLVEFGKVFQDAWLDGMRRKIGLFDQADDDLALVQSLLETMHRNEADFTLTFRALCDVAEGGAISGLRANFTDPEDCRQWVDRWQARLGQEKQTPAERAALMKAVNPSIIPRNHRVEEALAAAENGDFSPFEALVEATRTPYADREPDSFYAQAPLLDQRVTRTFCGT